MDNNSFKNFINQDFSGLSNWINTLDPYEFATVGFLAALLIAPALNANQMNSVGNFLEEIGQTLLTIASQIITVEQARNGNITSSGEFDTFSGNSNIDMDLLRREIMRMNNEYRKR